MPKPKEITDGLQAIVNGYPVFAILWHAAFYLLIIALIAKWLPSNRLLGILFCLPLLSVAVFAWIIGNPFNGSLFSILAILILLFALKANTLPVSTSQLLFIGTGILMIVFGLVYPHFISNVTIVKYFYATPVGLIPCPTLSILIGLALVFNGLGSNAISLVLIISGLFYGLFGVFRLAVHLDLFLVAGALALLTKYILSLRVT